MKPTLDEVLVFFWGTRDLIHSDPRLTATEAAYTAMFFGKRALDVPRAAVGLLPAQHTAFESGLAYGLAIALAKLYPEADHAAPVVRGRLRAADGHDRGRRAGRPA